MIAQARITSDTTATVHLAAGTLDLRGEDLPAIRAQVKDVMIAAAREAAGPLDVVIVEPDVHHHLRVEPSGRISGRAADDRPLYGPTPPAPTPEPEPEAPAAAPADSGPRRGGHRRRAVAPAGPPSVAGAAETDPLSSPSPEEETPAAEQTPAAVPSSPELPATAPAESPDSAGPVPTHHREDGEQAAAAWTPTGTADAGPGLDPAPREEPAETLPTPEPVAEPTPGRATDAAAPARPTLQDLQSSTARSHRARATRGWRGALTKLTGGAVSPRPGRAEREANRRLERIRRSLDGPRNIAVVNLKGGAHKTTASLMIAATLGTVRGGNVLAWDNNETRGTLGWRGVPGDNHRTAVDLLHDIEQLRAGSTSAADLDAYVRPQGEMRFDILASDEDAGSMASIDEHAFAELDETLSRVYRLKVIDTGNNVRASNWLAAVRHADQLVIVSTIREDTFNAAAWMIDELRATGLGTQVDHAVTVLSHSAKSKVDPRLRERLLTHFGSHTRAVVEVPFEKQFVDGSHLDFSRVSKETKQAWLDATAEIVDGL